MTTNTLLSILFILGLILIVMVLLIPSEEKKDKEELRRRMGENSTRNLKETHMFSWLSPNKTWITTKVFIVGAFLLLITPKYFIFDGGNKAMSWNLDSILYALKALTIEPKPFNAWTSGDILFIIIYVGILLLLVNIPLRYTVSDQSISYSILGIDGIAKHYWTDAVCFDIYNGELHIWFKPPIYKPDWSIPVPREKEDVLISIISQYCVRYSVKQNAVR